MHLGILRCFVLTFRHFQKYRGVESTIIVTSSDARDVSAPGKTADTEGHDKDNVSLGVK